MGSEHGANKGGFSGRLHLERLAMVDPEDVDATVGGALETVVADAAADELICLAPDMDAFEALAQRLFASNANVRKFRTSVVLGRTKTGLTVPL
jgi:hypothetical protein